MVETGGNWSVTGAILQYCLHSNFTDLWHMWPDIFSLILKKKNIALFLFVYFFTQFYI